MDPLSLLFQNSTIGLCSLNKDFLIIDCNEKFAHIFESKKENMIGYDFFSFASDIHQKLFINNHFKSLFSGIPIRLIKSFTDKEKKAEIHFEFYFTPIQHDEEVSMFICQITPILPKSKVVQFDAVNENLLQLIMDHIPLRIFWKDVNYRYLGCNKAFLQDACLDSVEEIIGKTDFECVWESNARHYRQDDKEIIEKGLSKINYEEIQYREDGQIAWLRTTKVPIKNAFGEITGVFGSYEDITEKKLAEQAIKNSEQKFRELVNFLPETIFEVDENSYFTYVSPNGLKTFGYNEDDLLQKVHLSKVIIPQEIKNASKNIKGLMNGEKSQSVMEYTGVRKNGERFPIAVASAPIEKDGKIVGVRGIVFDLTHTKNVQQELMKEKNMLKAFIDSLPDISFVLDDEGTYREFLSVDESMLLKSVDELKNKKLHDFFSKSEADKFIKIIKKTIKTKSPQNIEYSLIKLDGSFAWFHGRTSYFFDQVQQKDLVIWTAREITELKNIQNQLEENQENLSITLESIGDAVMATDTNGFIVRMNEVAEKITGWNREEALGHKIEEVLHIVDANTNKEVANPIYKAINEGIIVELGNNLKILNKKGESYPIADSAAPIRKKDGSLLGAIIVFHDVTDKYKKQRELQKSEGRLKRAQEVAHVGDWEYVIGGKVICGSEESFRIYGHKRINPCLPIKMWIKPIHPEDRLMVKKAFIRLIEDGGNYDMEYRIHKADTQELRYLRSIAKLFSEPDGRVVVLGTIQDITKSKVAEEELKIRNSELNNFVYRVSHDLRAPLSSIKGLIALQKMHDNIDSINYPEMMEKSINKLDTFIRDILSHSRNLNTNPEFQEIDFNQIIELCFEELAFLNNFNLIEKEVNITGGKYNGDQVRINEIFRNLISNSIKYSNPYIDYKYIKIGIDVNDKEVNILIEDNGIGIPHNIQPKVFDMFYRGNEKADGSGIGLYIVKQAVQKLNGCIMLESEPEVGSKFHIKLPNHPLVEN